MELGILTCHCYYKKRKYVNEMWKDALAHEVVLSM